MRKKDRIWLIGALCIAGVLCVGSADVELLRAPSFSQNKEFGEIMSRAVNQLIKISNRRPFKLRLLNDSLQQTARAAEIMSERKDFAAATKLLDSALHSYRENAFAILLQAILHDAAGQTQQANRLFEQYLAASRTFTDFEKSFLSWAEFHRLRKIVYDNLTARGISFDGRKEMIQTKRPLKNFTEYLMHPGPRDTVLSITFIVILFGGAILLFLASLWGVDFSKFLPKSVLFLYFTTWVAYGIWVVDLAVGLPFEWSRFQILPVFLIAAILLFCLFEFLHLWQDRTRLIEKGYRRCPHCKAIIPKLSIECMECRKKIGEK